MSKTYIYAFIRKDLPVVQQLIQLAHACHTQGHYEKCMNEVPNLVLFEVQNEKELNEAFNYVWNMGIWVKMFNEPDIGGQNTAFCSAIVSHRVERAVFKDFKLYVE